LYLRKFNNRLRHSTNTKSNTSQLNVSSLIAAKIFENELRRYYNIIKGIKAVISFRNDDMQ